MKTRVAFFGYGQLALGVLRVLERSGAEVVAVVVPENRDGNAVQVIAECASSQGRPLLVQPRRSAAGAFIEQIRQAAPDVIVVASYSMILPAALIAIPPLGAVNVHGGLLPEYRGPHILQWAIVNGEQTTGVTIHYLDEGIDTGPVIAIERVPIGPEEDAVVVKERLRIAAAALMERWWPKIADGTAPRIQQDESRARYWPLRRPAEGRIDWTMPAAAVCRLVRALASNDPGAYVEDLTRKSGAISIRRARVVEAAAPRHEPGTVIGVDDRGLRIAAADADVLITDVVADGRTMHGAELAAIRRSFSA